MISLFKSWVAPKAGVRLVLRARLAYDETNDLQDLVRSYGMNGVVRFVPGSHMVVELEGSKDKLDSLIFTLQHYQLRSTPSVLEVGWRPYEGQFQGFRVAM